MKTTGDATNLSTNVGVGLNQPEASSSGPVAEDATALTDQTPIIDNPNLIQDLQEERIGNLVDLDDESGWETDSSAVLRARERLMDRALEDRGLPPNPLECFDPSEEAERYAAGILDDDDDDMYNDIDDDEFDEEFEDGGAFDFEPYGDEEDYLDGFHEEYDEDYEDEDDYDEDEAEDEDEDGPGLVYPDRRSAETEFGNVEMITPRRVFKGARNIETVKDCMSPSISLVANEQAIF